jgi:hypothetical protein
MWLWVPAAALHQLEWPACAVKAIGGLPELLFTLQLFSQGTLVLPIIFPIASTGV